MITKEKIGMKQEKKLHSEKYCPECGTPMEKKDFIARTVYYCNTCFGYKQTELDCDHDFELRLFRLSNGNLQLRKLCMKCYYRERHILSQKDIDITKIEISSEEKYQEYMSNKYKEEKDELEKFCKVLKEKQEYLFHKDYYDYINSDQWKEKRLQALERDKYSCQICKGNATEVHHLTYAHFKNEYLFELISLCNKCHIMEYHSREINKKLFELKIPKKQQP
jgi:hypothetical protein